MGIKLDLITAEGTTTTEADVVVAINEVFTEWGYIQDGVVVNEEQIELRFAYACEVAAERLGLTVVERKPWNFRFVEKGLPIKNEVE